MSIPAVVDFDFDRFRAGDARHFEDLVRMYSPRVFATARAFATDQDDAQDLVQETWLRVFAKRDAFDGHGSFVGWLLTVCRTVCIDRGRTDATKHRVESWLAALEPEWTAPAVERALSDRLHRSLAELPDRQREAVTLRLLEGLSTREAARRMGCAEGTIKALLHQGIAALRNHMREP